MIDRVIHVLTGCTACGKTEAALRWAETHSAEIVSCDSLLFYCGMDIGTAKPTRAERARVPHHLVDVCEPSERMDVRAYIARARVAIDAIHAAGRAVLVTGGSGFYLKSFFAPVVDDVPVDAAIRAEIEHQLAHDGLEACVRRLVALNPAGLGALDVCNPRRVTRALERCIASGLTLTELAARFRDQPGAFAGFEVKLTELVREPDDLRERIAIRTRAMIAAGLIEEVRGLRERGTERNPSAASAIGYRETLAWLAAGEDRNALPALEQAIAQNTWALVRKQRTWFRTQLPAHRTLALRAGEAADAATLFSASGDGR